LMKSPAMIRRRDPHLPRAPARQSIRLMLALFARTLARAIEHVRVSQQLCLSFENDNARVPADVLDFLNARHGLGERSSPDQKAGPASPARAKVLVRVRERVRTGPIAIVCLCASA
jgi:hypothetical protein